MNLHHAGTYKLSDTEHFLGYYHDGSLHIQLARLERRAGKLCWCHKDYDIIQTTKPSQAWVKHCKSFGTLTNN